MTATRHRRGPRRRPVLQVAALAATGVLTACAVAAGATYLRLDSNVERIEVETLMGTDRPPAPPPPDPSDPHAGLPMNVLLLGSDSREGENAALGGENDGVASDTTLVMHLSADRSRVEMISIPRDSLVDIPACQTTQGTTSAASDAMFNSAFARGWTTGGDVASAAACAATTVESLTGVRLDGIVVADFAGFHSMVEALGGVSICIPEPVSSPKAGGLTLPAGPQVLDATQATQLSRARSGTGWGLELSSDLSRIDRQQALLGAMASTALDKDLVSDLPRLTGFVSAVTQSLTVSSDLGSGLELAGIALSLKDIDPAAITFTQVPVVDSPTHRYRVEWTSQADALWAAVRDDVPTTVALAPDTAAAPPAAQPPSAEGPDAGSPTTLDTPSTTPGTTSPEGEEGAKICP
jgi:LCP family protein required for cell wall assembly